MPNLALSY